MTGLLELQQGAIFAGDRSSGRSPKAEWARCTADDFMAIGTPYFFINGRRVLTTGSLDKVRAVITEEVAKAEAWTKLGVPRADIYAKVLKEGRGPTPLELKTFDFATISGPTRGAIKSEVMLVEFCDYKSYLCKLVDPMVDELLQSRARDNAIKDVPAFLVCGSDYCKSGGYVLRGGQPRRAFEKRVRLMLEAKGGPLPASP